MPTPGEVFDTNHDYTLAAERKKARKGVAMPLGAVAALHLRNAAAAAGNRVGRAVREGLKWDDGVRRTLDDVGLANAQEELPRLFNDEPYPRPDAANTAVLSHDEIMQVAAEAARGRLGETAPADISDSGVGIFPPIQDSVGRHRATESVGRHRAPQEGVGRHRAPLSEDQERMAQMTQDFEETSGPIPETPRQPGDYRPRHGSEDSDTTDEYPLVGAGR
jgi:hypothetical protein